MPSNPAGNVRALAIRDLVAGKPLHWDELPKLQVPEKLLSHCLQPGDVVIPSRGDYYKAWLFEGAADLVFPVGQLSVIRPDPRLDARYLVWHLNEASTQKRISLMLSRPCELTQPVAAQRLSGESRWSDPRGFDSMVGDSRGIEDCR